MMNDNRQTELDTEESRAASLYRSLPAGEPTPALDARIRAQARASVRPTRPVWLWGVGVAASAVFAVGLFWRMGLPEMQQHQHMDPRKVASPAPQTPPEPLREDQRDAANSAGSALGERTLTDSRDADHGMVDARRERPAQSADKLEKTSHPAAPAKAIVSQSAASPASPVDATKQKRENAESAESDLAPPVAFDVPAEMSYEAPPPAPPAPPPPPSAPPPSAPMSQPRLQMERPAISREPIIVSETREVAAAEATADMAPATAPEQNKRSERSLGALSRQAQPSENEEHKFDAERAKTSAAKSPGMPAGSSVVIDSDARVEAAIAEADPALRESLRTNARLYPESWLARIEKLRSNGKRTEALANLRVFVASYPDHSLPERLQRLLDGDDAQRNGHQDVGDENGGRERRKNR